MLGVWAPASSRRARVVQICLLVAWALVNLVWGRRWDALFIVSFFLFLSTVVRRHFLHVAVPVVLVLLFDTPVLDTLVALGQSNVRTVQHLDTHMTEILAWDSGREVLPFEVQQMLYLLRANHLQDYRVSAQLWQDFEQRIVEGVWPARFDPSSPNVFRLNTDQGNASCRLVRQRGNVILERCR